MKFVLFVPSTNDKNLPCPVEQCPRKRAPDKTVGGITVVQQFEKTVFQS